MSLKNHINIDQGTDFYQKFNALYPNGAVIDLTGHSANAQIRKHYTSTNSISFNTSIDTSNNTVTISLYANQTSNVSSGRYMYDVIVSSNSGYITRIIEGIATINPRVTR